MPRIKMIIEYDGSRYHGFQIQNNAHTVQAELEEAVARLSGEIVSIMAAGRTDAGVHALGQVIAFDTRSSIPGDKWKFALNSFLPLDIQVMDSQEVNGDFHPRFQAVRKQYKYIIYRENRARIFYRNYALCNTESLDIDAMTRACKVLEGRHNFKAFCASGSSVNNYERLVSKCCLHEDGPFIKMQIEADGFLYNMVRIIMGTLLEVGRGNYSAEYLEDIISGQDRSKAGATVPPQGLYLLKVIYPELIL